VNPFRLNQRLVIQQGVFTCPGDASKGFAANLAEMPETEVCAIRIGGRMVRECLAELQRMSMTSAVLYPGLDGFAWSLTTRLGSPIPLGSGADQQALVDPFAVAVPNQCQTCLHLVDKRSKMVTLTPPAKDHHS
jgi:hypothetical protein